MCLYHNLRLEYVGLCTITVSTNSFKLNIYMLREALVKCKNNS